MQQYYADRYLKMNEEFFFNDEDIHHIKDVLRLDKGEIVRIVFEDEAYLARIDYKHRTPFCIILKKDEFRRDLDSNVTLIQGLIKMDKWDLILQKSCELGVSRIIPLYSSRVNIKKDIVENKKDRWNKIIIEACKQCKREKFTELSALVNISDLVNFKSDINLVAFENDFNKGNNIINYLKKGKSVSVVIGPEGGFSEQEIKDLNNMGFINVNLGKRILRAETAGFYALSVIGAINER